MPPLNVEMEALGSRSALTFSDGGGLQHWAESVPDGSREMSASCMGRGQIHQFLPYGQPDACRRSRRPRSRVASGIGKVRYQGCRRSKPPGTRKKVPNSRFFRAVPQGGYYVGEQAGTTAVRMTGSGSRNAS